MADKGRDDEALIMAAVQGSPRAWEKLVRRYEGRVYNYGLRLTGNPADAMDMMQDVFIGVYRNLHRFRGESQFTSWLFRIAHNKAVDMNRRRRPFSVQDLQSPGEREGPVYDNIIDEEAPNPQEQVLDGETNEQLLRLLGSLSWEQRLLVELKIYQSLTFEEIAEMQEIPVNTAKTRFYTALRKMKHSLEPNHELSQNPRDHCRSS